MKLSTVKSTDFSKIKRQEHIFNDWAKPGSYEGELQRKSAEDKVWVDSEVSGALPPEKADHRQTCPLIVSSINFVLSSVFRVPSLLPSTHRAESTKDIVILAYLSFWPSASL